MITVNAAGEIVLQSLTRAQSFQITPAAVTTTPSSTGTASAANAAPLAAGVSAYVVTTNTSPLVGGHGVTLPAPSAGAQVTLIQSQTTFVSYTIWASASTVFINNDASTTSITAISRRVVCTSISSTRWNCIQDINTFIPVISTTSSQTLTESQSGSIVTTATTGQTFTLPGCSTATLGMYFTFVYQATAASETLKIKLVTGDIASATLTDGAAANVYLAGTTGQILTVTSGAAFTAARGASLIRFTCIAANRWIVDGTSSNGPAGTAVAAAFAAT